MTELELRKNFIERQKTKARIHSGLKRYLRAVRSGGSSPRRNLPFQHPLSSVASGLMIFLLLWHTDVAPFITASIRVANTEASVLKATSRRDGQDLALQMEVAEAAVVRHAPSLNGGSRIEGSVRQLFGEDVTLNGGVVITVGLLVPGTPTVRLNGKPTFGGTVEGKGSTQPSGYRVTLNGNVTLGHLVTRTDPVPIPAVAPPPASTGTRDVTLDKPGQNPGDFSTLRDLTVNGSAGIVPVPPGTYREFTANGGNGFVFGIAGSSESAIYNFSRLVLGGRSELRVVGPVILTLAKEMTLNGAMGVAANPLWLNINVAEGGVKLNGGSTLFGLVRVPAGEINLEGNTLLQGSVACDRLSINGNSMLKALPGALAAIAPTRAVQGQTLNVTLRGINTHWVAGQTGASFGGEVSVGGAPAGEPGPIQVIDATTATAQVEVSSTAALAPRTVRVVTTIVPPDDVAVETLIDGFTVGATTAPGASSGNVTTLAGLAGTPGFADGPASQGRFRDLAGIAVGVDDALYIADAGNNRIRVVRPGSAGVPPAVSTLAGDGTAGFADGPSALARFNNPQGVAVDANGIVYVADTGNHRIRRIAPDGTVTTLAGDGTAGLRDGGGTLARFSAPTGIALDNIGNIYVADTGNSAVRFVSTTGSVSTVAGDGTIGSNDSPSARFNGLAGIVVEGATLLVYLADTGNHRIRRLDASGVVITIAGSDRGFADGSASQARFASPVGIAIDGAGKIIVADSTNSLVREVDPGSASILPAVSTLAGTGDRGLTNGLGNLARFFTPRGVAVSQSSAIIVADTGNQVLRRIVLPPTIASITPSSGRPGDSVTISGAHFDGRSTDRNLVRFTRSAQAGGGRTVATVTFASRTQLSVTVPADAATGPVSVQTEGGTASSPADFEVITGPTIADFNPKEAPVGTLINVIGSRLAPPPGTAAQVKLNKQGGGTIEAPVASAGEDRLSFVIPTGAATGPVTITVNGQSATSTAALTIVASADFTLSVTPVAADLIQGQSITYAVTLASETGFTQLADLSVTGLPGGVTASFKPQKITAGQTSSLKLSAPATQSPGASALTVSASANVDGIPITHLINVTLNIRPITTSFTGQTVVADALQTPLAGVAITFLGRDGNGNLTGCSGQTISDGAGNFAFTNLPSSCSGSQLIRYDGTTATSPPGKFAGVDLVYNIIPNQVTVAPVLIHLPRIDNAETVLVSQNAAADQTITFRTIPNLSVTVYAGTTFTLVNGGQPNPFPLTAIQVPVDRLPDEMPASNSTVSAFIVAFQPANARASQPVAVNFPNTLNTLPGTNVQLTTLDPTKGEMVIYGTGTVSNDGTQIVPDLNPVTPGRRFGLVNFDWHGPVTPPNPVNPSPEGSCGPQQGDPVDLSSGVQVITETDVAIRGGRGAISIERTYRTLSALAGPFGVGTSHNYGFRLNTTAPQNSVVLNLIMPDGNQIPFVRQPNGTLINSTVPSLRGAVITTATNGTAALRWKDGTLFQFVPANFQLGSVLQSISDPNGNIILLTRNPSRRAQITEVIDPVGRKLLLTYDNLDRINTIADPIGRIVKYTYNNQGTLETVTNPAGGVTRYDYDAQNRLVRVTDARGVVVAQNAYDANGRVTQQVQPDGGVGRFAYTLASAAVPNSPVMQTVVTDPLGNQRTYRFNPQGFLIGVTDALGQVRLLDREPGTNLLRAVTGPASCSVCGAAGAGDQSFTYDDFGNLLTSTDALGNTTAFSYEPVFNKIAAITDPLGNITRFTYDARGNLITSANENNAITTFGYDVSGNITETIDPLNHKTLFTYDGFGNLTATTDALSNTHLFRYDPVSRLIEMQDPLGNRNTIAYDLQDRIITVTNALNAQLRFAYDPVGNPVTVTDELGDTTSFTYTPVKQVASITSALGFMETRAYDLSGNLVQRADRRGRVSRFAYDTLNQLIRESYDDNTTVTRAYDSSGRLTQVADSVSGQFTFTYDPAGRVINDSTPFGTIRYSYDSADQVLTRNVGGQAAVTYSYDPAGNLLQASSPQAAVTYLYDFMNRPITLTRSNGTRTDIVYDEVGRVVSLTHSAGTAILNSQSYEYDATGKRSSYRTNIAQPLITQSAVNQYDAGNRLLRRGSTAYSYDNNGNRISEITAAGRTNYQWDARNRLHAIEMPNGQLTTFLYDFAGNLISQQSKSSAGSLTRNFLLDDLTNVVQEDDTVGNQLSVLTGRGIDQHLAVIASSGQAQFALPDSIGSIIGHTDANAQLNGQAFYEPYGQTTVLGTEFPFQFTGRSRVKDSLYYYRARFYDPSSDRFISEDPGGIGVGGVNLFRYVENDPVNLTDPSGRIPDLGLIVRSILRSIGTAAMAPLPGPSKIQPIATTASLAITAVQVIPFAVALDERTRAQDATIDCILNQRGPACLAEAQQRLVAATQNVVRASQFAGVAAEVTTATTGKAIIGSVVRKCVVEIGNKVSRRVKE